MSNFFQRIFFLFLHLPDLPRKLRLCGGISLFVCACEEGTFSLHLSEGLVRVGKKGLGLGARLGSGLGLGRI